MATPSVDPRALMQAAMSAQPTQQGAMGQVPVGAATPNPSAMSAPGASAAGAAAPAGAPPQPMTSNTNIANVIGSGVDLSQDPQAVTDIVQMLQDPGLPPDQKAELQMRLQLAALNSLQGSGPAGAAGGQGS
jgi:hypothetical protein